MPIHVRTPPQDLPMSETPAATAPWPFPSAKRSPSFRPIPLCSLPVPHTLNHPQAYHNRGCTYIEQRDYDGCIKDFSRAIALNPVNEKVILRPYPYSSSWIAVANRDPTQ